MSTAESPVLELGPESNGTFVTPAEFDTAEFAPGWRYELLNGVLVVSPSPLRQERDPNEELGRLLRNYGEDHPQGASLDLTLSEETVQIGSHRRRVDRAIWAGLGRLPRDHEPPTITVEFVSAGRASRERDYVVKLDEYRSAGIREYWIIDRFQRRMTVHRFMNDEDQSPHIVAESEQYSTPLLPGFELALLALLERADRWDNTGSE